MTITLKDIDKAVRQWRSEQPGLGDSFWMSVTHADYPLGIDVQIEYVDDEESEHHNRPWAWVYPNVEQKTESGDVWLTTDTRSCVASFELPYHPNTEPEGRVLHRSTYTEADAKREVWRYLTAVGHNTEPDLTDPTMLARLSRMVERYSAGIEKHGPPMDDPMMWLTEIDDALSTQPSI